MKQEILKEWVAALRSGEYKQGKYCLNDGCGNMCCLGVLADIYAKQHNLKWIDTSTEEKTEIYLNLSLDDKEMIKPKEVEGTSRATILPSDVQTWADLQDANPAVKYTGSFRTLGALNDNGVSFETIANLIETQLLEADKIKVEEPFKDDDLPF